MKYQGLLYFNRGDNFDNEFTAHAVNSLDNYIPFEYSFDEMLESEEYIISVFDIKKIADREEWVNKVYYLVQANYLDTNIDDLEAPYKYKLETVDIIQGADIEEDIHNGSFIIKQ